jgi:hypothetical protein
LNDSDFDPEQTADNLLARWDLMREGNQSQSADEEFRVWLMRTVPELLEGMRPDPDNAQAHCTGVAATIERCVALGRLDDAFTLAEWLADAYVPRDDDLATRTILGTAEFCSDTGTSSRLNQRAIRLLTRVVGAAPWYSGIEMDWAVCKALMDLSTLYTIGRTPADGRHRTQASIDVCDQIIARWETSQDKWLRLNVAGAMLNKAMSLLEFHDEPAARQQYAQVIKSFAADGNDGKIGLRLSTARHALKILDTVQFPEPEFNTEYLEAQKRRNQRRFQFNAGPDASEYIHGAYQLHHETAAFIRHTACIGEPWVLILRNFDLMETSIATSPPNRVSGEQEVHGKTIYFMPGLGLVNQLVEVANVVQVANTQAAALEIDIPTMLAHGRKRAARLLYLSDSGWLNTVRILISLAEHIVVWAHEKTPALLQELALITELERTEDTSVLLEKHHHKQMMYARLDSMPPKRAVLNSEDPVLAGFPIITYADDANPPRGKPGDRRPMRDQILSVTMGDPGENPAVDGFLDILRAEEGKEIDPEDSTFLRQIMSKITSAQQRPTEERVARIRHRIDKARTH